ncbi:hypothetical protein [Rheinheimera sp. UJ63]|uniref:hypothetical protein n=1 Tax=Rheinheimera sp. UJ63 TaxID=2910157 RepID=UPI001F437D5D|nr:hypothetical protein [Rheinheimera sp. UJ63]MCF4010989.1 hypothetical protein [Rheinheimera sp. UJ63]
MIQIETIPAIRKVMLDKIYRAHVRKLTASLIAALKIDPNSRDLVAICGTGGEADNCEAVYVWVKRQTCCVSCIKGLDFKMLQHRFLTFLLDNSHQTEYYE